MQKLICADLGEHEDTGKTDDFYTLRKGHTNIRKAELSKAASGVRKEAAVSVLPYQHHINPCHHSFPHTIIPKEDPLPPAMPQNPVSGLIITNHRNKPNLLSQSGKHRGLVQRIRPYRHTDVLGRIRARVKYRLIRRTD